MIIETAIGFNSEYMVGHVTNDLLTLKRFCNSEQEIGGLTKEQLSEIIKELQKIYSLMHSTQKTTKKDKIVTSNNINSSEIEV